MRTANRRSGKESFRALFEELYLSMLKLAVFYTNDIDSAEDIVQDVFAKVWERWDEMQGLKNVKGYLQYAIKNKCLNYLQHLQVIGKYQQEYLYVGKSDGGELSEEFVASVFQLLKRLPEKRRLVFEQNLLEAKSYQEIALSHDISVNTVKDHIKKAYAFLREEARKENLYDLLTTEAS